MRRELLIWVFLTLATLAVFHQVGDHDFINLDDSRYVTENAQVQEGLSSGSVVWAFTTFDAGFWIPLTWLSFMLDFELYGLNAGGYHLTNLFFHLANTLLLFLILNTMTRQPWRSGFVAALFAWHPLHVESVAWVTERKDVLSTFFFMLAMLSYVHYAKRASISKYLLLLIAFAFGLMAKPMVVTLPFVLLLMDYWPLGRFQFGQPDDRYHRESHSRGQGTFSAVVLIREKLPLFALAAVVSVVTLLAHKGAGAVGSLEHYPAQTRIANALVSYVRYIAKMLWPQDLAVLYPHPGSALPLWQVAGAGLLICLISFVVIRAGRRLPYLAVGWLWYLGTLVPVIGLVQVGAQAMADRFTYIPLIGLFIITAWGVGDATATWGHRRVFMPTAIALVLIALMLCTHRQIEKWRDSITLFEHNLSVTSNNHLIHNNLGVALLERSEIQKAAQQFSEALRIEPHSVKAHTNLGVTLVRMGYLDRGIDHYYKALRLQPDNSEIHYNLGNALAQQGKVEEAMSHLYRALEIEPNHAKAHNNLGAILARQGKLKDAIAHFEKALKISPDFLQARNNLQTALAPGTSAGQEFDSPL